LFRPELLSAAIREANELAPDLVVIAGDLTMEGYRSEFEECRRLLGELECRHMVVTMGNLDAELRGWTEGTRIVVIHHHILAVPGTGRDVNTCATQVT
jgi:3',5'-cyclic AMP phosphodiesterase CpdA